MKTFHCLTVIILIMSSAIVSCAGPGAQQQKQNQSVYLFSYFMDNGQDGLHLACSEDGLTWKPLHEGRSFLEPRVGGKLMRDPSIVRAPDGVFHMVWTAGWWEKGIGYANSRDLIHWSEQAYLPVMEHEPQAKNTWAPELFYDEQQKQFLIFWATTIPGRFPETDDLGDNNHRIYYVTTKDFKTFSKTKLLLEPGFNVIDSFIVKDGNRYVMFLKDERVKPVAQKNIHVAFAEAATGPYGDVSESITGKYWAEGPTALKVGDEWVVYFDKYTEHKYGAVKSGDLKTWQDISDQIQFPKGTRHGTAFRVPQTILDKLQE